VFSRLIAGGRRVIHDGVGEDPDGRDVDLDLVPGPQPALGDRADAGRGAGQDGVAGLERVDPRDVGDELTEPEDEVTRL